jgi:putative DNA primase/helicase
MGELLPPFDSDEWDELTDETEDVGDLGEQHRGQLRLAERFAVDHADTLRHAHGLGWLRWDGTRWAPDRDGEALRAAIDTLKMALHNLADLDKRARDDLYADIKRVESASGLEGVLTIAGSLKPLAIPADALDPDPFLFNVMNGTLDLRTGRLRGHQPTDLLTKRAGCGFDPDAQGHEFHGFITEILTDTEIREFVQRVAGYAMLGTVREHVLPIFTGVGCNGKGTLLDTLRATFGDYAISAEPELLVDRGTRGAAHPTGQADLLGVRLAVTSETDEGRRLAAATVKRLTGGDTIRARRMRENFFEFNPSHTIIMMTNHKPKVSGDDPALWRRLLVVPFDVVIAEPDVKLPERLEVELPVVLAWAFDGYREYAIRGLDPPKAVLERTDAYRLSSDSLGRFLDEHTIATPAGYVRARELYSAWTAWCHATGEEPGSEVVFAEAMERHGFEKKRRSIGMVYLGLTAADSSDEEDR